jgi:hypothetical protein
VTTGKKLNVLYALNSIRIYITNTSWGRAGKRLARSGYLRRDVTAEGALLSVWAAATATGPAALFAMFDTGGSTCGGATDGVH